MAHRWRKIGLPIWLTTMLLLCTGARGADEAAEADGARFFSRHVEPILRENCFECHGGERVRSNFILTRRDGLLTGGDHGPAISLENPEQSLLLKMISYSDDDHQMPPSGKLPDAAIQTLKLWVKQGAPWPKGADFTKVEPEKERDLFEQAEGFWAFQPVKRPTPPTVQDEDWVRTPIDRFILARLEAEGMQPAEEADRVALIRRAYYDLLGLPPTPAEVDAFVQDTAPDAWERLIDRLLASPHYGEKWGRFWLDLVRYAETNSYERDNPKPHAWRYRDYVIRSFNEDKPYDRFVMEQLAGDELPDADVDSHIATGYYRLGIWDDEPVDRLQARFDMLDDIVTTTGDVFLGLTIGCARCHDHKIDPIPQADYYRLTAFFRNINYYRNGGPTDERKIFRTPDAKAQYQKLVAQRQKQADEVQQQILAIEQRFRSQMSESQNVGHEDLDDLRYKFYRDTWDSLPDFSMIKAETAGTVESGLFDIRLRTRDEAIGFVFEGTLIVPRTGQYTFFLNSDDGARLSIAGKEVVVFDGIHGIEPEKVGRIALSAGRVPIKLEWFQKQHGLGLKVAWEGPGVKRRLLSAPDNADADRLLGGDSALGAEVAKLIDSPKGVKVLGQETIDEYVALRKILKKLEEPVPVDKALVVTEAGPEAPPSHVLIRGNAHARGDEVQPGFPQILGGGTAEVPPRPEGATTTGRRLALARWITSPDNVMTARVMVNRIWQQHFGRGIVQSPSDFGLQGKRPTHPKLLDWLASEFVAGGWKMKRIHRLIMTSAAYRMSSKPDRGALAKDPANDLFWRFDMRRLTAEEIRDSILAVNGTLNLKMYGPSIYPPIPKEVLAGQSRPGKGWHTSSPEQAARRSVYIHVKRSLKVPIIEAFDAPESDFSCPVRMTTTQPTQALGMLNGAFINKAASEFAARLKREAGDDVHAQVARALGLITGRHPSEAEIERGVDLIKKLIQTDGASPEQALRYFSLMALNLNEFVYLD